MLRSIKELLLRKNLQNSKRHSVCICKGAYKCVIFIIYYNFSTLTENFIIKYAVLERQGDRVIALCVESRNRQHMTYDIV